MKKFFILTIGLILFFCVTIVQAETEDNSAPTAKQWWEDGYVRPPKVEAPAAPVEAVTSEETTAPAEVSAPTVEEPAAPAEAAAPKTEESAAPQAVVPVTPAVADMQYASGGNKQDVQILINKWLTSWQSGDMENYRNCYATDFQSKGQNLDAWVAHKAALNSKNKNVKISLDDLQIVAEENTASAAFIQHYSSSISKNSGKKILKLKKINNEWKIAKEIM